MSISKLLFERGHHGVGTATEVGVEGGVDLGLPDPGDGHPQVARERQDRRAAGARLDVDHHDRVGALARSPASGSPNELPLRRSRRTGGCRIRPRGSSRRPREPGRCSRPRAGCSSTSLSMVEFTAYTPAPTRPPAITSAMIRRVPKRAELQSAAPPARQQAPAGSGVGRTMSTGGGGSSRGVSRIASAVGSGATLVVVVLSSASAGTTMAEKS